MFLSFHTSVNTFIKFLAIILNHLSKLWCVIAHFPKIDPITVVYLAFSSTYLNVVVEQLHVTISPARIQPASRAMLQKELIIKNTELLLKMTASNLKKTWTNTALFEFGLANSDIRLLP